MDTYDSLVTSECVLNEQIASRIFDSLPEAGLTVAIVDRQGHCWTSDPEKFSRLNINESFLNELYDKIDDGAEPLITQANDCSIIATQLATERNNCGYVLICLPQYSPESTIINIGLIEALLSQIGLIASLIEENNLLQELQRKYHNMYNCSEIPSN